jgi:hypothetical protein
MKTVAFGGGSRERVEISVGGYAYPLTGEFYDDNWLNAEVRLVVGGFRGGFDAMFLTVEFFRFHEALVRLHRELRGEARFESLEGQLMLSLLGNGLGRIELKGEARDAVSIGNTLSFEIELDQTQLAHSLSALGDLLAVYPVRN